MATLKGFYAAISEEDLQLLFPEGCTTPEAYAIRCKAYMVTKRESCEDVDLWAGGEAFESERVVEGHQAVKPSDVVTFVNAN